MAIVITSGMIDKLGHDLQEIRIRALKDIFGKLSRGILVDLEVNFNVSYLLKGLIRWFGFVPVCEEATVLDLIIITLNSKYGIDAIKYFSSKRIEIEILKIKKLVHHNFHKLIVEILEILEKYDIEKYESEQLSIVESNTVPSIEIPEPKIDLRSMEDALEEIIDCDFVKCWSTPGPIELQSLTLLTESLQSGTDERNIKHALTYVKIAIRDLPAEYFLQPPYLIKYLMKLLETHKYLNKTVFDIIINFIKAIKSRYEYRNLSATYLFDSDEDNIVCGFKDRNNPCNQISTIKVSYDLIQLILENLKAMSNEENYESIILSFRLISEIIKLIEVDDKSRDYMYDILRDISLITKYYRNLCENYNFNNFTFRLYYIILINFVAKLKMCLTEQNDETKIWIIELKIACLDLTLKYYYPKVYNLIFSSIEGCLDSLDILLSSSKILHPTIEILRQPNLFNDEKLILNGKEVLNTLCITKSKGLVKLLFNAICNKCVYFDGSTELKNAGEELFLSLISHGLLEMRRLVYQMSGDKIKTFFNSVMEGETVIHKPSGNKTYFSYSLGIPINTSILTEIICFGYNSEDVIIHNNSEIILLLLLRGKSILGTYWDQIMGSINNVFPLLQCLTEKSTKLGHAILDLFDPNTDLDVTEMIKGNIRFLFSEDSNVREYAVARLLNIVSSHPKADRYVPNVRNISDTIPNDICYTTNPYNFKTNEIDSSESTVLPLLEILKSSDVQPSMRKSTLMQLSVMAGNTTTNQVIHDNDGWLLALTCLDHALTENHPYEYQDSAIPCVGLLAKLALQFSEFRREISEEPNLYFHLLRALFIYFHNLPLKLDCSVSLFLFSFSNYIVGSKNISIPFIFSKLKIPIISDYHWRLSPNEKKSKIEMEFLEGSNEKLYTQYFRLNFALNWFDNFEEIFRNSKNCKRDKSSELIDYSTIPSHLLVKNYDGIIEIPNKLDFNPILYLNKCDMQLIKTTSIHENFKYYLRQIENATKHSDVLQAIIGLEGLLLLPLEEISFSDMIMKLFSKYYCTPPSNKMDRVLFSAIINILKRFISTDFEEILLNVLVNLNRKNSVFETILNSIEFNLSTFVENCSFLTLALKYALKTNNKAIKEIIETPEGSKGVTGLFQKYFNIVSEILESSKLEKNQEFEKLHSVLSLYQVITSSQLCDYDKSYAELIINRLFHLISSTKSFSQTGADFNKKCLFCVGNMYEQNYIKPKYLKLLSGLCSHNDFEIRSCSWSLLNKISMNVEGAETVIKELSYLPGGIHACCLSTLLDLHEVPLVRLVAANLFATLISHNDGKKGLNEKVAPRCKEIEVSENNPINLINEIIYRQQFFEIIHQSVKHFYVAETMEKGLDSCITTCDVITGYCLIISNLIDLNESMLATPNFITCIYEIACVLNYIPTVPTQSSLRMVAETARLLAICFSNTKYPLLLERITCHGHSIMASFGFCLNLNHYDKCPSTHRTNCIKNILKVIRILIQTSYQGYEFYYRFWANDNSLSLVKFLKFALSTKRLFELGIPCMNFISSLLLANEQEHTKDLESLIDIFENVTIRINTNSDSDKEIYYGSEVIFLKLLKMFNFICSKDKPNNKFVVFSKEKRACFQAVRSVLKYSPKAQTVAKEHKFLNTLIVKYQAIVSRLGMSCTDYIRRISDPKKESVIREIMQLTDIIIYWYSNDCLTDETDIKNLCESFILLWPWINTKSDLNIKILNCLLFLSEDSIAVCRGISASTSSTFTLLQRIIDLVTEETSKSKNPQGNTYILEIGLRILSNCCSCIEGRIQLGKHKILDNISQLHPSITKNQKNWISVTFLWLKFWEIFSRYPEGGIIRHIPVLCSLIIKNNNSEIQLTALRIIRNMCFINSNRSGILSSDDILYIFNYILDLEITEEEQLIVVSSLWKLVVNNSKAKNIIKNSSIPDKLNYILKIVSSQRNIEENEFYNVLVILTNILNE